MVTQDAASTTRVDSIERATQEAASTTKVDSINFQEPVSIQW
jgi:hypothetical protein